MTLRYAGLAPALTRSLTRDETRIGLAAAANDNGASAASDAMLHAALRHFATHGLAAAQRARRQAEAAFFAGDRQGYKWWLEVCRTLDRGLARQLDERSKAGK
jgi:hypothetical protein